MLCFPMSVRKEVYEEPRGHCQPGRRGVVQSGAVAMVRSNATTGRYLALRQVAFYIDS